MPPGGIAPGGRAPGWPGNPVAACTPATEIDGKATTRLTKSSGWEEWPETLPKPSEILTNLGSWLVLIHSVTQSFCRRSQNSSVNRLTSFASTIEYPDAEE